jgi:UDP-GlcNAc:undecaprenyl-phosphate GlcNAc-1-phosphate transferase
VTVLLSAVVASLVTLIVVWPLRWLALKNQIMDKPGPRKSHTAPVPYLGGLAILAGVGTAIFLVSGHPRTAVVLLAFVALLGLVDDIRYLPVWVKLCGEITIAGTAVALGFSWHITDSVPINDGLSVLWIVGLTNSFNLLDNMDGLASTVAAGSLVALTLLVPASGGLALPLAAAALAFLLINRPPAKMYMGDAGSLMLGFGVALTTIGAAQHFHGLHSMVILAFPVAVAILDTSLVIVSRLATGRPVQLGGQDHFSHRLRLIGWSRYQVLGAAVVASIAAGAGAALAARYPLPEAFLAIPLGLAFLGAWAGLLRVDPYTSAMRPRLEVYVEQPRL